MMTSSDSLRWNLFDRNSSPRIGISPNPGTLWLATELLFWIKPAMAKLWPLASSTVVLARLTVNPGTTCPEMRTLLVKSSWLTSGWTRMLMRLPASSVGVKERPTPKFLNSTVMTVPPPLLDWGTGTGNSPPARKLAVSPDKAVRLGSARTVTSPSVAKASMKLLKSQLPVAAWKLYRLDVWPSVLLTAAAPGKPVVTRPIATLPILPAAFQLMPSWRMIDRSTSANRTRRLT